MADRMNVRMLATLALGGAILAATALSGCATDACVTKTVIGGSLVENYCSEGLTKEECGEDQFLEGSSCEDLGYGYYCNGKDIWLDGSGGCYD